MIEDSIKNNADTPRMTSIDEVAKNPLIPERGINLQVIVYVVLMIAV